MKRPLASADFFFISSVAGGKRPQWMQSLLKVNKFKTCHMTLFLQKKEFKQILSNTVHSKDDYDKLHIRKQSYSIVNKVMRKDRLSKLWSTKVVIYLREFNP